MTEGAEIWVPDDASVYLGVSAGNYAAADDALWKLKAVFGDRDLTSQEQAHLDQIRDRRKAAYQDLVSWVMTVEATRVGVTS